MGTSLPYQRIEDVDLRLAQLKAARDHHAMRVEQHWTALQDRDMRGRLLKDAVHDALHAWRPAQQIASLFSGGGGASHFLTDVLTRRGGFMRRIFSSLLVMAAPALVKKIPWSRLTQAIRDRFAPDHNGSSLHAAADRDFRDRDRSG